MKHRVTLTFTAEEVFTPAPGLSPRPLHLLGYSREVWERQLAAVFSVAVDPKFQHASIEVQQVHQEQT